jgi:TDG/mug DNA glycosylase family protein
MMQSNFLGQMAELSTAERRAAVPAFLRKVHKWRPKIVCMVGKGIWEDVFSYICRTSKSGNDGIVVEKCSMQEQGGPREWDKLKTDFEFDIQPVCLLHSLDKEERMSKDGEQWTPVEGSTDSKRTLFFVVPSTSTRVRAYQVGATVLHI